MTLARLYELYLRKARIDQQTLAAHLAERPTGSGKARHAKTWRLLLTKLRSGDARPRAEDLHAIAEELDCSPFDEQRLLRAADYYPSVADVRAAMAGARSWLEALQWPAFFLDYRANILGWNRQAVTPGAGNGARGIDLQPASARPSASRRGTEAAAAITHLLLALFDEQGLLHPLLAAPPFLDAMRLCVFVLSYWEPLDWPSSQSWRGETERKCRRSPHFADVWNHAHSEWGAHLRGAHNAYGGSPLHNTVQITLGGTQWRLLPSMLEADARIEVLEFLPLGSAPSATP